MVVSMTPFARLQCIAARQAGHHRPETLSREDERAPCLPSAARDRLKSRASPVYERSMAPVSSRLT